MTDPDRSIKQGAVEDKANTAISTSRSPSQTAQPKRGNLLGSKPQEQSDATGTNSSSTSTGKELQSNKSDAQEHSLKIPDYQEAKFEAQIDLAFTNKQVTSTTKGKNS